MPAILRAEPLANIKVFPIGVGGGGSDQGFVNRMIESGLQGRLFISVNTIDGRPGNAT